jgi:hypothetical protein
VSCTADDSIRVPGGRALASRDLRGYRSIVGINDARV